MKFNRILLRILCLTLMIALACGIAAKLHVDGAEYKVEFDANGGTGVQAQYVAKGELATAPVDPTRDGYTFLGWFHNENPWSFETPVKSNMILVAHWEKIPAECPHVDKNDDGKCDLCEESFQDGSDLPAPNNYSIVYMDGANKLNLAPSSYNVNSTNLVLPTPEAKAHLEFVGWYLDANFTTLATEINVNANANLVFYAKYSPVTYRVNYELDGGVNAEGNVPTYNLYDLPINLAAPSKDGYEFKGWYTDANCTAPIESITAENADDLVVYAKWEKIPVAYHVYYIDHNDAQIGGDIYYESAEDQPLRSSYDLPGYTFLGWVDPVTGEAVTCIPAGTTGDIYVKASVQKIVISHTVYYWINGEEYETAEFDQDTGLANLLTVAQTGWKFDGWYNEIDEIVTSIPAGTETDVNLYATLEKIVYNVTYLDENGNTLTLEPATYTISESVISLPEAPAKEGAITLGWFNQDGVKVTEIAARATGDLTLQARYETKEYTITYYTNGGVNNENNVESYYYGNIPTLYDPESRDGYAFAGWYNNAEFSGESVESIEEYANQSISLFAKWVAIDDEDGTVTPEVPF